MYVVKDHDLNVQNFARDYVKAQAKRGMVSTTRAVRAIRTVAPDCALTDRELADVVAEQAVIAGCAIDFDVDDHAIS